MDKDEKLRLVNGNGETVLMTKSEYLDLAKQKGWDAKIPQLNGTYDCDVFGGDDVCFHTPIYITGNLFLGDNACTYTVRTGEDAIYGSNASICSTGAGGQIMVGANSKACAMYAESDMIVGANVPTPDSLFVGGDIIFEDEMF